MKCLRLVLVLVLLMQSLYSHAHPIENPLSCSLPAPAWINATNITSSSITVEWEEVVGSYGYRVTRFDVTNGVQLPDVDVAEPEYTSEPHDPGTTISFEVMAKCENGELGASIGGEYTTEFIIVDDIVSFSVPTPPIGNIPVNPSAFGYFLPLSFVDANKNTPTVNVLRTKVKYTDPHNNLYYAEVLYWSHCSTAENGAPHVMYWDESNWPQGVSYEEIHLYNNPALPIIAIEFKINNGPFFTIDQSYFTQGLNGEPNVTGLKLHNDLSDIIRFDRSDNTERNPCYEPSMQGKGNNLLAGQVTNNEAAMEPGGESTTPKQESQSMQLQVSPNPFSENFKADYGLESESTVSFTLYDLTGRIIQSVQLPKLPAGHYSTVISTDNLPAGIYLLAFQTNQGRTMTPLVKH